MSDAIARVPAKRTVVVTDTARREIFAQANRLGARATDVIEAGVRTFAMLPENERRAWLERVGRT